MARREGPASGLSLSEKLFSLSLTVVDLGAGAGENRITFSVLESSLRQEGSGWVAPGRTERTFCVVQPRSMGTRAAGFWGWREAENTKETARAAVGEK